MTGPLHFYRAPDGRWIVIGAHAETPFRDPQYSAGEMLVPIEDPGLGEVVNPAVVPRLSHTPGEARWSGRWGPGCDSGEVYGGRLRIGTDERFALAGEGVT